MDQKRGGPIFTVFSRPKGVSVREGKRSIKIEDSNDIENAAGLGSAALLD